MLPVGFERATPAGEWPHIYALDRAATGTFVSHVLQKLLKILEGDKQTKFIYRYWFSGGLKETRRNKWQLFKAKAFLIGISP